MEIEPHEVAPTAVYKLLTGCVVPRPIAWVSSVDAEGVRNLAPFSYFMAITDAPPTIAFSSGPSPRPAAGAGGKAPPGGKKDTLRNVETTGDFVVNVVDDTLAEQMNLTSGDYPAEVDEFALARLTPAPSVKVKAPRIAEAPISLECRLVRSSRWGRTASCSARSSASTCAMISTTGPPDGSTSSGCARWGAWPARCKRTCTRSSR